VGLSPPEGRTCLTRRRSRGPSACAALALCGFALGVPGRAQGELYLAVFGGAAFSESKTTKTQLNLNGASLLDGTFRDVDFQNSPLVGGKIGYFLPRPLLGGHLGSEFEFYYTQPRAPRQTVTFTGTGLGAPPSGRISVQSADFEIWTLALNVLYRMPFLTDAGFPLGRVQLYGGPGVGAFIATIHTRTSPLDVNRRIQDTDVQPGVQAVGGLKLFLLRNLALFAEYRFAQTAEFTFDFKQHGTVGGAPATETARDRSDSTQHQAAFGIAVHW
jgi:opacity protein-like surface antigen